MREWGLFGGSWSKVDSAQKIYMGVNMMHTYTILQPLRSFTPSLSLGGVNAPCESEMACQH